MLVACAAALRCIGLGRSPLWLDEAFSVLVARGGPAAMIDSLSRDGHPPLFFLLLHGWMALFGDSEAAVRTLPVLFGAASVAAVYAAGRALFPRERLVAPIAAVILAVGPLHVYYSRQCRMYSLTPLIGILALFVMQRGFETEKLRSWAALAVLLTLGLYTHNYFLFLLPVGPVAALIAPGRLLTRRSALARSLSASTVAAVAYLPWLPILIRQSRSGVGAWIPGLWAATPPWAALLRSFEVMGIGGPFPGYLRVIGAVETAVPAPVIWVALRILGVGLGAVLVVAGLTTAVRRAPDEHDPGVRTGLFLALPLVIPWAASWVATPIYLVGRYEMVSFGGYALLAARGFVALISRRASEADRPTLSRRTRLPLGAALAILWLVGASFCFVALLRASTLPRMLEEKRIAEWLRDTVGPADSVILPGYTRGPVEYYLSRWGSSAERVSFPSDVAGHLGWFDPGRALQESEKTRQEAADLASQERRAHERGGHVVLVLSPFTPPAINQWLGEALQARLGEPRLIHPGGAPSHALAVYGGPPN